MYTNMNNNLFVSGKNAYSSALALFAVGARGYTPNATLVVCILWLSLLTHNQWLHDTITNSVNETRMTSRRVHNSPSFVDKS